MSDAVQSAVPALEPITSRERILTLDVLRGLALLGVLVANAWMWFSGLTFTTVAERAAWGTLDQIANTAMHLLVQWKSFGIFSFLFGLGFAVQMLRAEERGVAIGPLYRRRLLILFGFGVLHAIFLYYGDILFAYAILGFLLLLFRRWSDRVLITSAIVALGIVSLLFALAEFAPPNAGALPAPASLDEPLTEILAGFQSGSYPEIVRANLQMLSGAAGGIPAPVAAATFLYEFGFFLLGLLVGRRRIFENVSAHRPLLLRTVRVLLPIAIAAHLLQLMLSSGQTTRLGGVPISFAMPIAAALTALVYLAGATLLLERERWRRPLSAFAPVGRMALTNYLAQSVICLAIFYGGGLVGRIGPAATVAITGIVFLAQMLYSHWWLTRFRFGPMEWLWRSLTYGRVQPLRRALEERRPAVAGVG